MQSNTKAIYFIFAVQVIKPVKPTCAKLIHVIVYLFIHESLYAATVRKTFQPKVKR